LAAVAFATTLAANPIFLPPPAGELPGVQGGIVLLSLWAEALVVAWLAKRKAWVHDATIWFAVTCGTFLTFIVVPFMCLGWAPSTFRDMHDSVILILEVVIVAVESLIFWLLWLRKAQRTYMAACLISGAGNLVSFAVSQICFYYAFLSR